MDVEDPAVEFYQPKHVFVTIWCTDNKRGEPCGVLFCDLEWEYDRNAEAAPVTPETDALAKEIESLVLKEERD